MTKDDVHRPVPHDAYDFFLVLPDSDQVGEEEIWEGKGKEQPFIAIKLIRKGARKIIFKKVSET